MDRKQLSDILNNSSLPILMTELRKQLVAGAIKATLANAEPDPLSEKCRHEFDKHMLACVGPAAASSAMELTINHLKAQSKLADSKWTSSPTRNYDLVFNDNGLEGFQNFSSVLRQFLLPRYSYLDFDQVIDPRHLIDLECGYPKFITPIMYRYMYDRDDVSRRVVDIYPDETWAVDPVVYEQEDEDVETPFEEDWRFLCEQHHALQYLYRSDKLSGIGHYGVLLLGIDDGKDLEEPVDGITPFGTPDPAYTGGPHQLLYLRPFDEYLSFIHMYETDVMNPRYGLPKFYNLVFLDMTIDAAGASIGTRLNRRVHWTRVVHIADNLMSSLVFGTPRMQPVFNRLLDLRKIKGSSAEMFWKAAWPGISFEINPQFVTDNPEFDRESFREEIQKYSDGLQRYLALIGISAKSLAPNICEHPESHVNVQMQAIASHYGVPLRIFMGSEESRLASSQDKLTWNQRLGRRLRMHTEPYIIRNFINRCVALRIMRPPAKSKYFVDWSDLNTVTDEDKANLALKWTQAISQYVASGAIHLIPPMDYFTMVLGFTPRESKKLADYIKTSGGLAKLQKVDPSAAGNNQERIASHRGDSSDANAKAPKRDKADKQTEGNG